MTRTRTEQSSGHSASMYPTADFDLAEFERILGAERRASSPRRSASTRPIRTATAEQVGTFVSRLKAVGGHQCRTPRRPAGRLAAHEDGDRAGLLPGVDLHRVRLPGLRPLPAQQRPGADGARVRARYPRARGDRQRPVPRPVRSGTGAKTRATRGASRRACSSSSTTALHYAGPTLTAQNMKKGLFAAPAARRSGSPTGLSGYGKTVGLPYDEYSLFGSDRALIWWDADQEGPTQATNSEGKGVFQFLNDGDNVGYNDFTKTTPKFFDPKASVFELNAADNYPGGVLPDAPTVHGVPLERRLSISPSDRGRAPRSIRYEDAERRAATTPPSTRRSVPVTNEAGRRAGKRRPPRARRQSFARAASSRAWWPSSAAHRTPGAPSACRSSLG